MFQKALEAMNAAKAFVILAVNYAVEFGSAFGIYDLTEPQQHVLTGGVNGVLFVYLLVTYTRSKKRIPE